MGFTAGFLGGVTLTSSILYLSVAIHRSNRQHQATLISQQNRLLTNVMDPQPPPPREVMKEVPAGVVEMAKDRWNREIEGLLRRAYETDWNAVRAQWEERIVGLTSSATKSLNEARKEK